jgi:DNA replication protein DnaC
VLRWRRLTGQRYRSCTFENFRFFGTPAERAQQQRMVEAVRTFATNLAADIECGRNLLLFGPPGTGKDHLLAAVLREVFKLGPRFSDEGATKWTSGAELFASMRDTFDSKERTESRELGGWLHPAVLAISDPQPPFARDARDELTKFESTFLLRVIDARYRDRKPTFVTLNGFNRAEAASRIGAQVVDRLGDDALVCFCNWPSYRKPSEMVE